MSPSELIARIRAVATSGVGFESQHCVEILAAIGSYEAQQSKKQPPQEELMPIRIAVAVASSGSWNSAGWGSKADKERDDRLQGIALEPMEDGIVRCHWVECMVPIPAAIDGAIPDVTVTPAETEKKGKG